jgi:hypothetical protein
MSKNTKTKKRSRNRTKKSTKKNRGRSRNICTDEAKRIMKIIHLLKEKAKDKEKK